MSRSAQPLVRLRSIYLALPQSREVGPRATRPSASRRRPACSCSQTDGSPRATRKVGTPMQGVFPDGPGFFKPDDAGPHLSGTAG